MPKTLANAEEIEAAVTRLGESLEEVVEDPARVAFVGIHTHGVPLAQRLKSVFDKKHGTDSSFGTLDITLYRDDYDLRGIKPRIQSSEIRFSIDNLEVILVDDVAYTGRTVRAAIESLGDYGRPRAIRLAVLADRGWRELPIQPDLSGFTFKTDEKDRIRVRMNEIEEADEILLIPKGYE